jgi:hypothetical protein
MAESRSQGFRVYYHDKVDLPQLFLIASELPKAAVNSFAGLRRFFSIFQLDLHITTFVVDVCLVKKESSSTISSKLLFVKRNACSTEQQ